MLAVPQRPGCLGTRGVFDLPSGGGAPDVGCPCRGPNLLRAVGWKAPRARRGTGGIVALFPMDSLTAATEMMMGWVIPVLWWGCGGCRFTPSCRPGMVCPRTQACPQALGRDRRDGSFWEAFVFPSGMAGPRSLWGPGPGVLVGRLRGCGQREPSLRRGSHVCRLPWEICTGSLNGVASEEWSLYLGYLVDLAAGRGEFL